MAFRIVSVLRTNNNIGKCGLTRFYADSSIDYKSIGVPFVKRITKEEYFMDKDEKMYHKTFKDVITVLTAEDVGLVSGVPEEHIKTRKVRIFRPAKDAMQSGTNNVHFWQIDFDTRERWENPLMGWTSTGDPMSNVKVDFASEKEAIAHCEKMGWEYYVQKPNVDDPKPRSYGINFSWNKRTRVSTK